MWVTLLKTVEKLSARVAGVSVIGGLLLAFLGFFDIANLKSIALRSPEAWPPIVFGIVLVAVGVLLHVLKPPTPTPGSAIQLSGGLIFVLRHLDAAGDYRPASFFAYPLYVFNSPEHSAAKFKLEHAAWSKASDYAVRCLILLGLARQQGSECAITSDGRKFLASVKHRAEYMHAFSKPLVSPGG